MGCVADQLIERVLLNTAPGGACHRPEFDPMSEEEINQEQPVRLSQDALSR